MKKTLSNADGLTPEHPPWCDSNVRHSFGECSSLSYEVTGINVGTSATVWLTMEPGGSSRPVACLELGKEIDLPASSVYLDWAGLRALADEALHLADLLEGRAAS